MREKEKTTSPADDAIRTKKRGGEKKSNQKIRTLDQKVLQHRLNIHTYKKKKKKTNDNNRKKKKIMY